MYKPYLNACEPNKEFYLNRTKRIEIFSHYSKHRSEDSSCENEDCTDIYCEGECKNNKPTKPKDLNLQKVIDLVPTGISLSDVKFEIEIDIGDMAIYGQSVTFYYLKPLKPDVKGYEKAKKAYDEANAKYLEEKIKYDAWEKQDKINKLQKELEELKK